MASTQGVNCHNALSHTRNVNTVAAIMQIQENRNFMEIFESLNEADLSQYYGPGNIQRKEDDCTDAVLDYVFEVCGPSGIREEVERRVSISMQTGSSGYQGGVLSRLSRRTED